MCWPLQCYIKSEWDFVRIAIGYHDILQKSGERLPHPLDATSCVHHAVRSRLGL